LLLVVRIVFEVPALFVLEPMIMVEPAAASVRDAPPITVAARAPMPPSIPVRSARREGAVGSFSGGSIVRSACFVAGIGMILPVRAQ
jgi:hypothetical protein